MSEIVAAASPSRTSVSANVDVPAAMLMSAAATMPMPPARTAPATRATTGFGQATIARCTSTIRCAPTAIPTVVASARSAPAQNTSIAERITTTRTASSAPAVSRCSISSPVSCCDSAFLLCGESSVIARNTLHHLEMNQLAGAQASAHLPLAIIGRLATNCG